MQIASGVAFDTPLARPAYFSPQITMGRWRQELGIKAPLIHIRQMTIAWGSPYDRTQSWKGLQELYVCLPAWLGRETTATAESWKGKNEDDSSRELSWNLIQSIQIIWPEHDSKHAIQYLLHNFAVGREAETAPSLVDGRGWSRPHDEGRAPRPSYKCKINVRVKSTSLTCFYIFTILHLKFLISFFVSPMIFYIFIC